ncbi:MAG: hypothetical protein JSU68_09790 [Phycisphaerales bacterium]|nr:MAG: hypothetical protein JSU68_09790 [Phycisphaerales bacterium]
MSFQRDRQALLCTGLLSLAGLPILSAGCQETSEGRWEFKSWESSEQSEGEAWTILCLETYGPEGREPTELLADALRKAQGLEPDSVRLVHDGESHRLYYGTYYRHRDADTGEYRIPPELRRDMSYIRQLATGQTYPFLHCLPVPRDSGPLGPPEWDLRRAPGDFTLLVAVYSDMPERREAAIEHVRLLREEGEEAYYYHHLSKSHVCVGSFVDSSADPFGGAVPRIDDPACRAARRKHPHFIYNGQYISNVNRDSSGNIVSKTRQPTRLVRIPRDEDRGL